MRRVLSTLGMLAVVVACVVAITLLSPAALPRVTRVAPPSDTKAVCLSAADSGTVHLSGADAVGPLGATPSPAEQPTVLADQTEPVVATGTESLVGGVLSASGTAIEWTPCGPAMAQGSLVVPSSADTELLIVNSDPSDASIDLTIHSAEGEIAALGARGILVAAGSSRVIALSVLADVEGPVGVSYSASRGRATVIARTQGLAGLSSVLATAPDTTALLPGITAGTGVATVLLSNATAEPATVDVTAFGTTARYQPAGGAGIEVPAHSTVAVPLGESLAGEATNLQVTSSVPITAALATGVREPAVVAPVAASRELAAVVPAGGVLQLSAPGEEPVSVTVTDAVGGAGGAPQTLTVPSGGIITLALATDAPQGQLVTVEGDGDVFGAVAFVSDAAALVVPLQPSGADLPEPLAAELDPSLN